MDVILTNVTGKLVYKYFGSSCYLNMHYTDCKATTELHLVAFEDAYSMSSSQK